MAREHEKSAAPVAPGLFSRVRSAAGKAFDFLNRPIFYKGKLPEVNMPAARSIFKNPVAWAGQMGRGYLGHLKSLGERGGVARELKSIDPLSLGLLVVPELTGQGIISGVSKAPEGEKTRELGSALGGLLGGQLMWRTGLLGSIGGSYLGSRLGETVASSVAGRKKKKRSPELMSPSSGVTPGTAEQPMILGQHEHFYPDYMKTSEKLPEVSGTSPQLSLGGPGREEVASRGRVSNRNNEYFGGESLRNVGDLAQLFYAGRGLGSQGGQPYADGSIFRHLGLDPSGKVNPKSKRELGDSSLDSASSDYL